MIDHLLACLATGAGVAWAAVEYPPEGGTWDHGYRAGNTVWSAYHHPSREHKSSAWGRSETPRKSAWEDPGQWSNAHDLIKFCGVGPIKVPCGNKVYYDVR